MVLEDIMSFLRGVAPFSDCGTVPVRRLAAGAELVFCPAGTTVPESAEDLASHLHLVRKGSVAVPPRGEVPACLLTAGAWLDDTPEESRADPARAATDVLCLLLERSAVDEALAASPDLAPLLTPRCGAALCDRAATIMRRRTAALRSEEGTWRRTSLAALASRAAPCVAASDSIGEAARVMVASGASAVLVTEDDHPCGIVTVRDLAARVVAAGAEADRPVRHIMSSPVFTLPPETPGLDALLAMTARNIHHVAVAGASTPSGQESAPPLLLSGDDLLALRGASPAALFATLREATGLSDLVGVAQRVDALALDLLCEGASPGALLPVVSRLHDRLVERLLHIAEDTLGPPPVPYAFLTFGRAAREESLFRPVQRTGIVHADPASDAARAARYFHSVGGFVTDALAALGFARDPNGRMASSPEYTLPLSGWHARFDSAPDAELCDMRPVHGDTRLADTLRVSACAAVRHTGRDSAGARGEDTRHDTPATLLASLVASVRTLAATASVTGTSTRQRLLGLERSHEQRALGDHPEGPGQASLRRGSPAPPMPFPQEHLRAAAQPAAASVSPTVQSTWVAQTTGDSRTTIGLYEEARHALDLLLLVEAHASARDVAESGPQAGGSTCASGPERDATAPSPVESLALRRAAAVVARMVAAADRCLSRTTAPSQAEGRTAPPGQDGRT